MKQEKKSRLVYSTESGQLCPECQHQIAHCICKEKQKAQIIGDGQVRISRETKGRKGKGVTLISGLSLNEKELKTLAKQLKQRCGTGGAVKKGVIEIQGDQRDILFQELQTLGYQPKRSGG